MTVCKKLPNNPTPLPGRQYGFFTAYHFHGCHALAVASKDGESSQSSRALLMEIEKMRRFGFTDAELERAKTNYLRRLERAVENAGDRMNAELVRPLINHLPTTNPSWIRLTSWK